MFLYKDYPSKSEIGYSHFNCIYLVFLVLFFVFYLIIVYKSNNVVIKL